MQSKNCMQVWFHFSTTELSYQQESTPIYTYIITEHKAKHHASVAIGTYIAIGHISIVLRLFTLSSISTTSSL